MINLRDYDPETRHVFPLSTDLMVSVNLPIHLLKKGKTAWKLHFMPKDFVSTNFGITLETFKLEEEGLFENGKKVTIVRKELRKYAEELLNNYG